MNANATPPIAVVSLSRQEKEKLLEQMYHVPHWIELIRLFRYQTLPMDEARAAIKPIAEKYGKEAAATACETLVDISTQGSFSFAKLKPHILRMAFQILGPAPIGEAVPTASSITCPTPNPLTPTVVRKSRSVKERSSLSSPRQAASGPATEATEQPTIMDRYRVAKKAHPDMLLLFHMGDFYELFAEDAEVAHQVLGLTLTTRDRTLTMAGFPHHQLEVYLTKLLQAGKCVAICEPAEASGSGGREVARVVTAVESPVRQPRHFVLKQCEQWFTEATLAFVSMKEAKCNNPAITPYVGVLDFIVLRGDEKLLVTVRPHLQAKHTLAFRELQKLYGPDYHPVRMWPCEGPNGWVWREHPIDISTTGKAENGNSAQSPKRPRVKK